MWRKQALEEHCERCRIRLPLPNSITAHFDLAVSVDSSETAPDPPPGWGMSILPPTLDSLRQTAGVGVGRGVRSVEVEGHVVRVVGGPARLDEVIRPHVNSFSGLPRVDRSG